jgi:hypothetical protein
MFTSSIVLLMIANAMAASVAPLLALYAASLEAGPGAAAAETHHAVGIAGDAFHDRRRDVGDAA